MTNDNWSETKQHETDRSTKIKYNAYKFNEPEEKDGQEIIEIVSTQTQRQAAIFEEEKTDKPSVDINNLHAKFGHASEKVLRATMHHLGIRVNRIMKSCDSC